MTHAHTEQETDRQRSTSLHSIRSRTGIQTAAKDGHSRKAQAGAMTINKNRFRIEGKVGLIKALEPPRGGGSRLPSLPWVLGFFWAKELFL